MDKYSAEKFENRTFFEIVEYENISEEEQWRKRRSKRIGIIEHIADEQNSPFKPSFLYEKIFQKKAGSEKDEDTEETLVESNKWKENGIIAIIEPLRKIESATNKELLHIDIYFVKEKSEDFMEDSGFNKGIPCGYIETDILKLRNDINLINQYGLGLLKKEVDELRVTIESNYRSLRQIDYKIDIYDIAKELFIRCVDKNDGDKGLNKNHKDLYCIPYNLFSNVYEDTFGNKKNDVKLADTFKKKNLVQKMVDEGLVRVNKNEINYMITVDKNSSRCMAFVKEKMDKLLEWQEQEDNVEE